MDDRIIMTGAVIFCVGILIFGSIIFFDIQTGFDSIEEIIVIGEVTNVETFDDYLLITFNNDSTKVFKVNYPKNVDLTVNSELIIKLSRATKDGIILKATNHNWNIKNIVKIP